MARKKFLLIFILLQSALAAGSILPEGFFLEKVDLKRKVPPDFLKQNDEFEQFFSPWVTERGAKLELIKERDSSAVNAAASREDDRWFIKIKGGLLKHREMKKVRLN